MGERERLSEVELAELRRSCATPHLGHPFVRCETLNALLDEHRDLKREVELLTKVAEASRPVIVGDARVYRNALRKAFLALDDYYKDRDSAWTIDSLPRDDAAHSSTSLPAVVERTQPVRIDHIADLLKYARENSAEGMRAVVCRMTPGPCFCGMHITKVDEFDAARAAEREGKGHG